MDEQHIIALRGADIYQEDNLVLSQVNLEAGPGQMLYLVGRVGSGKSSLIKTLTAELPLRTGEGAVCGFSLRGINRKQVPMLRRRIGVVFQDFQLLTDRNVTDNLLFVLRATGWRDKEAMKRRIAEVLDLVELRYKEYKMPHQLSGGEQQRVVIARALLNNPEVILADEPTGNLDAESSDGIMQILHAIAASGKAVLMATHNVALMRRFPGITYKCERGRLTLLDEQVAEIDFGSLMEL
ncbi:MAG: ATP-binding cassette domain-containing protein [Bacteroidales bacterium]|nr:ATP-binding cassette domain-containing protein [Bacteroidales bacterium]